MRFRAISQSALSTRKRIAVILAAAVSALLGGTLAAVAATGTLPTARARRARARRARGERSGGTRLSTVHFHS